MYTRRRYGVAVLSLAALALLFGRPGQVNADPILLYNTGVGTPGSIDPHYSETSPILAPMFITIRQNGVWVTAPAGSQWISFSANGNGADVPAATFGITTTFDLTGLNPATATISGELAADNFAEIFLNGVDTGIGTTMNNPGGTGRTGFAQLLPFTITSGFEPGVNTLTFELTNDPGKIPNPSALLVADLTGTAAPVPEPSSLALLSLGGLGLAGWRRWKRRVTA
jgi:PEP-CTERM motif